MPPTLETKLAAVMKYLIDVKYHGRVADTEGYSSYLNDPEIVEWVDRMEKEGRIGSTRFIYTSR